MPWSNVLSRWEPHDPLKVFWSALLGWLAIAQGAWPWPWVCSWADAVRAFARLWLCVRESGVPLLVCVVRDRFEVIGERSAPEDVNCEPEHFIEHVLFDRAITRSAGQQNQRRRVYILRPCQRQKGDVAGTALLLLDFLSHSPIGGRRWRRPAIGCGPIART